MNAHLLEAALAYSRLRGWAIVPIGRDWKGREKAVLAKWTPFQTTPPTDAHFERWFRRKNVTGLGVVLGPVSGGLVCRDFDRAASYHEWAAAHPDLAVTLPTAETGRGFHVYFRADFTRTVTLGDGELRGKGVCILPPSIHPSGKAYRWIVPLPEGDLPMIDPAACGLATPYGNGHLQRDRETERQRDGRHESPAVADGLPGGAPAVDGSVGRSVGRSAENPDSGEEPHGFSVSVSSVSSVSLLTGPDADLIEAAIVKSRPTGPGMRNGRVFALCRELKAIPSAANATLDELRPVVRRWFELARPVIGTQDFDSTWADFVHGWARVKFPAGSEPVAMALAAGDAAEPPACAARFDCPKTRRIIGLCRELQRIAGDAEFFIDCRTLGRLIGLDHALASKRLGMLVAEDVLRLVERGQRGRASRFRYIGGD